MGLAAPKYRGAPEAFVTRVANGTSHKGLSGEISNRSALAISQPCGSMKIDAVSQFFHIPRSYPEEVINAVHAFRG